MYSKENHKQNEKTTYRLGENINLCDWQGIDFQNIQIAHKTQYHKQTNKQPNQKMGRPGVGNGNPLQYSCLGNPMDGGAWWAAVHGVSMDRTWLSTRAQYLKHKSNACFQNKTNMHKKKKWAEDLNSLSSNTDGQQAYENMLHVTNH